MALVVWDSRLELGHGLIDEQHRHLLDLANALHETVVQARDKEEVLAALALLREATLAHFAMEEGLMQKFGYSGAEAHKDAHTKIYQKALDLSVQFQADFSAGTMILLDLLEGWLVNHIHFEDAPLVAAIRRQELG